MAPGMLVTVFAKNRKNVSHIHVPSIGLSILVLCMLLVLGLCWSDITASDLSIDDNVWLRINWQEAVDMLPKDEEILSVTSSEDEKYKCVIPSADRSQKDKNDDVSSEPVSSIIRKLHEQSTCSYRMEQYWTYELCHGKHVRQYHEEKEAGQQTKLQEYYLGRFDKAKNKLDADEDAVKSIGDLPTKRIEDKNVPYYEVIYTDGTYCDLIDGPRMTRVYYVCHEQGHNEMYSQEETSSCEYQVTILTHALCQHPLYRPIENAVTDITCYPQPGTHSPTQPSKVTQIALEKMTGTGTAPQVRGIARQVVLVDDDDEDDDDEDEDDDSGSSARRITVTVHADGTTTTTTTTRATSPDSSSSDGASGSGSGGAGAGDRPKLHSNTGGSGRRRPTPVQIDKELMRQFLQGTHCLQGGKGYWKYEICYGRYVQQYHEEYTKTGKKSKGATVNLGHWDIEKHKKLLMEKDPRYKDKVKTRAMQMYMKHTYVDGDVCDVTGVPRFVEVKLKCVRATNANQVSIYLSEPKTCEYVMMVESPIICQLLDHIDEFGIPQVDLDQL